MPEEVEKDIGLFGDGPIADAYFRSMPGQILREHGPESLTKYCELQKRTRCHTPCVQGISGCTTADQRLEPLLYQKTQSAVQAVLIAVFEDRSLDARTMRMIGDSAINIAKCIEAMKARAMSSKTFDGVVFRGVTSMNMTLDDLLGPGFAALVSKSLFQEALYRGGLVLSDAVVDRLIDKIAENLDLSAERKSACLKFAHFITLLTQATLHGLFHTRGNPTQIDILMVSAFWSGMVYGALARKYGLASSMFARILTNTMALVRGLSRRLKSKDDKRLFMYALSLLQLVLYKIVGLPPPLVNKYHIILQHSQRFVPHPPDVPMNDNNAGDGDDFHDAFEDIDSVNDLETDAILQFETESRLDTFYDALMQEPRQHSLTADAPGS